MTTMGAAARRRWPAVVHTVAVLLVAVLIPAIAFVVAFPQRTDYVGHYLAGAGGTALILAAVLARPGRRPWLVAATTNVGILIGVGTEATVFRLAIFDPVDLASQSLGALVVGAALVGASGSKRLATCVFVVAALLLATGFGYAFA